MISTSDSYPSFLAALCLWREARGESLWTQIAIKHVLLNRVAHPFGPYRHCQDLVSTILCPAQFSSFNADDPNAKLLPNPAHAADWRAWLQCCGVVDRGEEDPTGGATHYFDDSIPAPAWADPSKLTIKIGRFSFYRLA